MYFINEAQRKYYKTSISHDLFGQMVVIRDYGSLDSKRHSRKTSPVSGERDATALLDKIRKVRERRGYVLKSH